MAIRKKTNKKKVQTKASDRSTGYWILVLNPDKWTRKFYHTQAIFDVLWQKGYWGIKGTSDSAKVIREGDVIVLYIASPYRAFAGCAVVTKTHNRFKMTPRRLFDPRYRPLPQEGIRHEPLAHFETQVPMALLVDKLKLTRATKPKWGIAVRGAVRALERQDFIKIVKAAVALNNKLSSRAEKIIRDADTSIRSTRSVA
jgi:hypothetical protein